jgi:hypothetical protein
MEVTCNRCHQPLEADSLYCPTCGLPQLVYSSENGSGLTPPEKGSEVVCDAGSVDWKAALRVAMLLAIPAGLLSCGVSPLGVLSLFWMSAAAAWAVTLYVRSQQAAWLTMGAGARIGLVTGVMAAALAFAVSGADMFVQRFVLHHANLIDDTWKSFVDERIQWTQHFANQMGSIDQAQLQIQLQAQKSLMLSPEGHAAYEAFGLATDSLFLLLFAVAGGAMSARLLARSRRSQI